jgi:hypothetical protein
MFLSGREYLQVKLNAVDVLLLIMRSGQIVGNVGHGDVYIRKV